MGGMKSNVEISFLLVSQGIIGCFSMLDEIHVQNQQCQVKVLSSWDRLLDLCEVIMGTEK